MRALLFLRPKELTMLNKNASADFTCPNCKKKFTLTVGQMAANEGKCPHCGVPVDSPNFERDAKKKIKDIERIIKNNLKFCPASFSSSLLFR
jgi:transcription initiation factor IIE alpha subunit